MPTKAGHFRKADHGQLGGQLHGQTPVWGAPGPEAGLQSLHLHCGEGGGAAPDPKDAQCQKNSKLGPGRLNNERYEHIPLAITPLTPGRLMDWEEMREEQTRGKGQWQLKILQNWAVLNQFILFLLSSSGPNIKGKARPRARVCNVLIHHPPPNRLLFWA